MIRSMTGFSRRERQGPWGTLVCELRTVNHRYLEVSLRLPDELKPLDNDVRQSVAAALRRGKVDASLYLKSAAGAQRSIELDTALLAELLARVTEVRRHVGAIGGGAEGAVSPLDILRWPGVIRDAEIDTKPVLSAALELLREALAELNDTRGREGQRIRELLLSRCAAMRTQVQLVRTRLPEISQRLRERIDEEMDRLAGHLEEVTASLESSEPAGRRLDFLMQELNREANTLSSKSQDTETTRAAVDMKVMIEQMREQIQNVE
jgi:uncharacterized protein (TIGR00255 family)